MHDRPRAQGLHVVDEPQLDQLGMDWHLPVGIDSLQRLVLPTGAFSHFTVLVGIDLVFAIQVEIKVVHP